MSNALSKSPSFTNRENLGEPVTLVLSPINKKLFTVSFLKSSRPLNVEYWDDSEFNLGLCVATLVAIASICSGVVPQQPPTKLTR